MSLNKFMHPRNIYKSPPNFKELAILYPEFRKYCKQDVSGKIAIDFKDPDALRALTKVLLTKDFGLQVEIPSGRLVPTLPLRLNYLLWIEDLLCLIGTYQDSAVRGIDIGTGASCIYPLLAAKKNGWYMTATEINSESVDTARANVERNNLQEFIQVQLVDKEKVLLPVVKEGEKYDFCMCNPPFFKCEDELDQKKKSRTAHRHPPHNAWTASVDEAVAPGGEVALITKVVEESLLLKNAIRIYTTMIGVKTDLRPLKDQLQKHGVKNAVTTEFCQGRTTRWGLAWTFSDLPDLQETLKKATHKKTKPMVYTVPPSTEPENYSVDVVCEKVLELLGKLQITYQEIKTSDEMKAMSISAHQNTWTHQRRHRRKMKKTSKPGSSPQKERVDLSSHTGNSSGNESTSEDCSNIVEMDIRSRFGKREAEESSSDTQTPTKKIKLESDKARRTQTEKNVCESGYKMKNKVVPPILNASLVIKRDKDNNILVELTYIDGSCGKDGLHQILQFIKNNMK